MSAPWPNVSLSDLIRLERRPVEVIANQEYQEIGVYCFGRGVFHKQPRSGLEVGDKNLYQLRAGDLILQVTFAWEGAIALCSAEEDGLYGSTRYPTFRVDEERCYPPFLLRYLCTRDGLAQINKICPGSAGRNRVLSIKRIPEVTIPLPPLPEQRRIVARIEALATKIEEAHDLRGQTIEEVEALRSSAISKLSGLKRWKTKAVREIVGEHALCNGKSVKSFGERSEVRCLVLSSMRNGRINLQDNKAVPLTSEQAMPFLVRRRDVFVMRGNGSKHLCGQAGLAEGEGKNVIFPDLFIRVSLPESEILAEYFVAIWNSGDVRSVIAEKAKTTSGIWKVNQGHIASTLIPVPPLSEQRRIVAYLDGVQAKVDALKKLQVETGSELAALLPSILDKAFKGEL